MECFIWMYCYHHVVLLLYFLIWWMKRIDFLKYSVILTVLSCSVVSDSLQVHGLGSLLSMWFLSRQEYWNGLPCPPPGVADKQMNCVIYFKIIRDFPGGPVVKNLPAMQETWIWFLVQEDSICCGATKPTRCK